MTQISPAVASTHSPADVSTLAGQFYDWLIEEVTYNPGDLPEELYQDFYQYYHHIGSRSRRRFSRHNWTCRVAPMARALLALPKQALPWRVLDAGCGLGTEALFWSTLRPDLEVTGVDISAERLALAEKRRSYYEAKCGRSLKVQFRERDVFKVVEFELFDAIWTMEAISHIDPAEEFLELAWTSLWPGGLLAVSDSHATNLYMLWRIYRLRKSGVASRTQKTTEAGEVISYAQERLFSVSEMVKMLRQIGYVKIESQLSVYFPPSLAKHPRLYSALAQLEPFFNRIPLVRKLGGVYTILARSAGESK